MKRIITLVAFLTLLVTGLQAQIIDATNNSPHKKEKTSNNSSIYKPTGHYMRFEMGYGQPFSMAYGYQLNPFIMIGGGVGVIVGHPYNGVPIYAEILWGTPYYKWSCTGDIKIGYSYGIDSSMDNNIFIAPSVSVGYKDIGLNLGIHTGYHPHMFGGEVVVVPTISIYYNLPLNSLITNK